MSVRVTRRPRTAGGTPRVLLTRDADGCRAWAEELTRRGIESASLPCLEHRVTDDAAVAEGFRCAVAAARTGDWLVFTSRRGVESAGSLLLSAPPKRLRLAAVGPATADACRQAFGRCDLVPGQASGESLAATLADEPTGTALLGVARRGRRDVEEALRPLGWQVRRFDLYDTVARPFAPEAPGDVHVDAVFLASPSAVRGFVACAEPADDLPLLAIGATTAAAIAAAGLRVAGVAETPGLDGLARLLPSLDSVPEQETIELAVGDMP